MVKSNYKYNMYYERGNMVGYGNIYLEKMKKNLRIGDGASKESDFKLTQEVWERIR